MLTESVRLLALVVVLCVGVSAVWDSESLEGLKQYVVALDSQHDFFKEKLRNHLLEENPFETKEQADEFLKLNKFENFECTQTRQNLIEEAKQKLESEFQSYATLVSIWQYTFCKLDHKEAEENYFNQLAEMSSAEFDRKFGKQELTLSELEFSEKIEKNLAKIDEKEAAELLTSSRVSLSSEVTKKLLEIMKPNESLNFALGHMSTLMEVLKIRRKVCQFEYMSIALAKAMRYEEHSLGIAKFMRNVAAEHVSECKSAASTGQLGLFARYFFMPETTEYLHLLLNSAAQNENELRQFENEIDNSKVLQPKHFELVVEILKEIADEKIIRNGQDLDRFYHLHGRRIFSSCEQFEHTFEKYRSLLEVIFGASSGPLREARLLYTICKATPGDELHSDLVHDKTRPLKFAENMDEVIMNTFGKLGLDMGTVLSGEHTDVPIEKAKKVFLEVVSKQLNRRAGKQSLESNLMQDFIEACSGYRAAHGLFWLRRAGYPFPDLYDGKQNKILLKSAVCSILEGVYTDKLILKWVKEESRTLSNRIRNLF